MHPLGVVPVHPPEGGQLDVFDRAPPPLAGPADQLALVGPVDGLGQGVDAPIDRQGDLRGSRGRGRCLFSADVREQLEQSSGEVAIEASDDVLIREPVSGASLEVGDGRACHRKLTTTARQSAALAWRFPPRLGRCRPLVLPDPVGIGATPHILAKAVSLRTRPALSPAVISICAATASLIRRFRARSASLFEFSSAILRW